MLRFASAIICISLLQTAATAQHNKPSVLLPPSEARKVGHHCSRSGPSKVDGTWQPSNADLQGLETALANVSTPARSSESKRRALDSYRQYVAITISGHKFIYINAFCEDIGRMDWKKHLVDICDGGNCFWGALYDPATHQFSDWQSNGEA